MQYEYRCATTVHRTAVLWFHIHRSYFPKGNAGMAMRMSPLGHTSRYRYVDHHRQCYYRPKTLVVMQLPFLGYVKITPLDSQVSSQSPSCSIPSRYLPRFLHHVDNRGMIYKVFLAHPRILHRLSTYGTE